VNHPTSPTDLVAYVKAAAALQGIALTEERLAAVAAHLARTQQLAQLLDATPLLADDELAEIYRPLAFFPL
jgi:hypothetical protein